VDLRSERRSERSFEQVSVANPAGLFLQRAIERAGLFFERSEA